MYGIAVGTLGKFAAISPAGRELSPTIAAVDDAVRAAVALMPGAILHSGAAALLRARHPGLSPQQLKSMIKKTASPGPIPGDPDQFPEGVLNVSTF